MDPRPNEPVPARATLGHGHPSASIPTSTLSTTPAPAPLPIDPAPAPPARSKPQKAHVPSACVHCKKAHLACDLSRPCKRCVAVGKEDTCRDVEHKKRGRPKLVDKTVSIDGTAWGPAEKATSAVVKVSSLLSTTTSAAASALAKTRVKAKYTKSSSASKGTASSSADASAKVKPSSSKKSFAVPSSSSSSSAPLPEKSLPSLPDSGLGHPFPDTISLPPPHTNERPSSALSHRSVQLPDRVEPLDQHDQLDRPPYHRDPRGYGASSTPHHARPLSMHSEPLMTDDRRDSFPKNQVKDSPAQEIFSSPSSLLATLFLTMDLRCARVSDESQALWGYHPHELSQKSIHSLVASEDHSKLQSLQHLVKDAVFSAMAPADPRHLAHFPFLESPSAVFYQNRPGIMSSSAPGSIEYVDVVRVCFAHGGSGLFSLKMYVGGGLGTDLVRGLNLEHAYLVCVMAKHSTPPPVYQDRPRLHDAVRPSSISSSAYAYDHAPSFNSPKDQSTSFSLPPILSEPLPHSILTPPTAPYYTTTTPSSSSSSSSTRGLSSSRPFAESNPSSSSYTVSLSKPGPFTSALPSMRSGPLHTAGWLYDDSEPFGPRPSHTGSSSQSSRATPRHNPPHAFAEPFGSLSAPMGGFGVSKYLHRSEPSAMSFNNQGRHALLSPQDSGPDPSRRLPRTLQRDLSSSAYGASFASRSPPMCTKRPLADMADVQDRNRDIDSRHQDHLQHQYPKTLPQESYGRPTSTASTSSSRSAYGSGGHLDLQSMPPDHPSVDHSVTGVCPVVHASLPREPLRQKQQQPPPPAHDERVSFDSQRPHNSAKPDQGACPWAKMAHSHAPTLPGSGSSFNHEQPLAVNTRPAAQRGCMTGTCGNDCRCHGEDDQTKAVRAMEAARKRMSVHSLLC